MTSGAVPLPGPPDRSRIGLLVPAAVVALAAPPGPVDPLVALLFVEFALLWLFWPVRTVALDRPGRLIRLDEGLAGTVPITLGRVERARLLPESPGLRRLVLDLESVVQGRWSGDPDEPFRAGGPCILFEGLSPTDWKALAPALAGAGGPLAAVESSPAALAGSVGAPGIRPPQEASGRLADLRLFRRLATAHFGLFALLSATTLPRTPIGGFLLLSFALFYHLRARSGRPGPVRGLQRIGALAVFLLGLLSLAPFALTAPVPGSGAYGGFFGALEGGNTKAAKEVARKADMVYRLGDHGTRLRLVRDLLALPDAETRWDLACSLRDVRGDATLRMAFLTALGDPDLYVKWVAALTFVGDLREREVEPMLALLADPSAEVREKAERVLGRYAGRKRAAVRAALAAAKPSGL